MIINEDSAVALYLSGKSLRGVCREVGISESKRNAIALILVTRGIEIKRTGKPLPTVGIYREERCPTCGKSRQIKARSVLAIPRDCKKCATSKSHKNNPRIGRADNHYNWKGGINLNPQGYVVEYVKKDNPFFSMAFNCHGTGGYILQHRLAMAKNLGRCLSSDEIVHHINGDKTDNRLENLNLIIKNGHKTTYQDGFRDGYAQAMKDCNKAWNGTDWQSI